MENGENPPQPYIYRRKNISKGKESSLNSKKKNSFIRKKIFFESKKTSFNPFVSIKISVCWDIES